MQRTTTATSDQVCAFQSNLQMASEKILIVKWSSCSERRRRPAENPAMFYFITCFVINFYTVQTLVCFSSAALLLKAIHIHLDADISDNDEQQGQFFIFWHQTKQPSVNTKGRRWFDWYIRMVWHHNILSASAASSLHVNNTCRSSVTTICIFNYPIIKR